jgi:membrane AbrB-like protein
MRLAGLGPFNGRTEATQWLALLGLSIVLTVVAEATRLPAALMIGPMIAAVIVGTAEGRIRVPPRLFLAAQGMIGCMIGRSIPLSFVHDVVRDWPIFLAGILSVIVAASLQGLLLTRWRVLPGTTAIWGTSPGASTSMIIMSEPYGGDIRLVAVMQNLRVISVAATATVVAKLWPGAQISSVSPAAIQWFPPLQWASFAATLVIAGGGAWLATVLKIPAGSMLLPMAGVIALHETGWLTIALPPWLLAISYALVGWSVGLRFTRPILRHAFYALPVILGSIASLIIVCGFIAAGMVLVAGIDPLTAYLATSPGGLDTVAIVAAASNVDLSFVMAMQTTRLVVVLITSPAISRVLARRVAARKPR